MRYVKRWNNGFWVIFDMRNYCPVELCRSSRHADHLLGGGK